MASDNWKEVPVEPAGEGEWKEIPIEKSLPQRALDAVKEYNAPSDEPGRMGRLEALGRGALQGSTYDFADKAGAGLQAGMAAFVPGMSMGDTYRQALSENKQDLNKAATDRPMEFAGGRVIGTIASPANALVAPLGVAKAGLTLGALSGLGRSEAKDIPGQLGDTLKGGLAGMGGGVLASRFPLLTGLGVAGAGKFMDDPELMLGGGLLAGAGALSGGLSGVGKALDAPGEAARLKIADKFTKGANATTARDLKSRFRLLQGATEPVDGAPAAAVANGAPAPPDLEATARGKLGAEAQENYRFLRSKDPLGLKLGSDAQAGVQALLPDYEAQANEGLGRFAKGKEARLKDILAGLQAETQAAPAAGAAAPEPNLGFKPSFDPRLLGSTASLKPDPLAGFAPKTTKELMPQLKPQVESELARMRAEQGLGSRFAGGLAKSALNPLVGGGLLAGAGTHSPTIGGSAAVAGVGKTLAADPVLATKILEPVGKALSKGGALADRVGRFLGGATGPVLVKKIQFLMQHDPEFAAASHE